MHGADLTAVIGFHPNLKPLQRHKGLGLRIPGPLVVEEAESGGDVSYAEVVCCLLDLGVRREPPGSTTLVYVLDEPTTGLHLADVEQLLALLGRLVEAGKSVIISEHHQAVMAQADWIIDLGPGAGHDGGRIMFEGTPADLLAARSTLTGKHLAAYVGT